MEGKYCDSRVEEGLDRLEIVKICKNDPPLENDTFSNLGASHKELRGSKQSNPVLVTNNVPEGNFEGGDRSGRLELTSLDYRGRG